MFCHTLNTWLLAQLLHPFLFEVYFFYRYPDEVGLFTSIYFFFTLPIIFFLSVPSLLMARMFLAWLTKAQVSFYEKLFIWVATAELAIFINFSGLLWIADGEISMQPYEIIIPAAIAALLAIMIRIKQFFVFQSGYEINDNENNLI